MLMDKVYLRIIVITISAAVLGWGWDIEIQRIEEALSDDPFWDISHLRVSRVKPGVYGFNGNMTLKVDLYDNVTFETKAYYSASGTKAFRLSPMRLAARGFCKFMNTDYKRYFMKELSKCSNFPYIAETKVFCPLKAGIYEVDSYEFEKSSLPRFLAEGLYKFTFLFNSTKDDNRAAWDIIAKITGI